ncbi:MAG: hypothetical protein U1D30_23280 [Planctomycetota bacterium]
MSFFFERLALYVKYRRLAARRQNDLWSELAAFHEHIAYLQWLYDRDRFGAFWPTYPMGK